MQQLTQSLVIESYNVLARLLTVSDRRLYLLDLIDLICKNPQRRNATKINRTPEAGSIFTCQFPASLELLSGGSDAEESTAVS